ncbi:MAG TPA: hypothetical protein VK875_13210 [Euzebyales bacterium]|nr:hypothetical protein [Euzebyales bacterium]
MTATAVARPQHRILLVREWDSQTSGSGCCGRLGGDHCAVGHPDSFDRSRALMETMGGIYRALRQELPADRFEITIVDPRNMVWLIPAMLRDGRRRGFRGGELWRQLNRGVRNGAIVVDGRALSADDYGDLDDAVGAVLRELAAARQPPM